MGKITETIREISRWKPSRFLFQLAFWSGNLLVIGVVIFNWATGYIYPVRYINSAAFPPDSPEFINNLIGKSFIFIYYFSIPILIINLIFFCHLIFIRIKYRKIEYNFITIAVVISVSLLLLNVAYHIY